MARKRTTISLLLPLLIFLLVLYAYPLLSLLVLSFVDPNFTLQHYIRFFNSPAYFQVFILTFKISTIVTLFCILLGYPVAYLLASAPTKVANILMIFVVIPLWTSILVRTYAWMVLLGRQGIINNFLSSLEVISSPLKLMYNLFGVNVGMIHILLPFAVFPMYSVMKGIDRNLLRAAQNLGASPIKAFLRIFLPLSLPGVGASVLLSFVFALGFFITPALLGGLRDVMISMLIEIQVVELLDWGFASALSVILLLITFVLFLIFNRLLGFDKMWGGGIS